MKLSELFFTAQFYLTRAADRLESESWFDPSCDKVRDHARALRAIAPALVELVRTQRAMLLDTQHNPQGTDEYFDAVDRACGVALREFTEAMEKAGVTCE